jgi:hypothetical protein
MSQIRCSNPSLKIAESIMGNSLKIGILVSNPDLRASMASNRKKLIEEWDVVACSRGLGVIACAAFDVASHGKGHSQCVN